MEFTTEELAILRAFDTADRETVLWELRQALPDVCHTDTRRAMKSAIGKLEAMSDEDFDALSLDADGYYFDSWEDYE